MKAFARLCDDLRAGGDPRQQAAVLAAYLGAASDPDRLWALALLSGQRPKRLLLAADLGHLAAEIAGVAGWMLQDCLREVGDMAETAALLVPPSASPSLQGLSHWLGCLHLLAGVDSAGRRDGLAAAWRHLGQPERTLLNRLAIGGFRLSLGQGVLARALGTLLERPAVEMAASLAESWSPHSADFAGQFLARRPEQRFYDFAPEARLTGGPEPLGPATDWLGWLYRPGLRAQLSAGPDGWHIWTADGDWRATGLPELAALATRLPPGTMLEGVLAADTSGQGPATADPVRRRLDLKRTGKSGDAPVALNFWADDLLEWQGIDQRALPYAERRRRLADLGLTLDPLLGFADWAGARAAWATAGTAGGLVLAHRRAGLDGVARWIWPCPPVVMTAVLIYCEAGRAGGASRYSFALRDGSDLVPIGQCPVGLAVAEQAEIARWVAAHTVERFGPVRRVAPELLFDLACDRVGGSARRKSGLVLEDLRILRWRQDNAQASQIATLRSLAGR